MSMVRQTSHPTNNPAPGDDGHDHWGSPRPAGLSDLEWRCYGDRYPGGHCRWLTDSEAGQRQLARREYARLYPIAEQDAADSCSLDRVLIRWRLRDIAALADPADAVRELHRLLGSTEDLSCPAGELEVSA